MTNRCRMLLILCLLGGSVGLLRQQDILSLACLSILIWIFGAWCLFRIRVVLAISNAKAKRVVDGRDAKHSPVLWVGREFVVELQFSCGTGPLALPCSISDFVPNLVKQTAGFSSCSFNAASPETNLRYTIIPLASGGAVFPGAHITLYDSSGLFLYTRFVNSNQILRCLPRYDTTPTMQSTVKRLNHLPQHGIHRLKRAGLGSELLELREYQSGDAPKSIAWKVSARREQLMTRQYESEVPVRVTLLVDGHPPARSGPLGARPIDRLNDLAATICNAAIRSGDAVGLVLVDQDGHRTQQPAFGDRALHQVLRTLAGFSIKPNQTIRSITPGGIRRLTSICRYLFPDLMDSKTNLTPMVIRPIFNRSVYLAKWRLANLFSILYGLSPLECCKLAANDSLLGKYADRMLTENGQSHLVANAAPANSENWSQTLSNAIHTAILRARDNEIFVILSDAVQYHDQLDKLLDAVKVAVARHHRVLVICPEHTTASNDNNGLDATTALLQTGATAADVEAAILASAADLAIDDIQRTARRKIRQAGAVAAFASPETAASLVMGQAKLASTGLSSGARV